MGPAENDNMQRIMSKEERDRIRQRGLEAETRRKGRTAQVLEKAPKSSGGKSISSQAMLLPKNISILQSCPSLSHLHTG